MGGIRRCFLEKVIFEKSINSRLAQELWHMDWGQGNQSGYFRNPDERPAVGMERSRYIQPILKKSKLKELLID